MVTFVPGFVSRQFAAYDRARNAAEADIQSRFSGDTARIRSETRAWAAANPRPEATLSEVADHIEHIRKVAGPDHVGIGGDFDGISVTVTGLEDVSSYPALFAELSRRGWSDTDMRKLAGENLLRAFGKAEEVAARLQRTRPPSTKTIAQLDGPAASQ
jgi:membrane dipeptidase